MNKEAQIWAPMRPHEWLEKITQFSKAWVKVPGLEESSSWPGTPGGVAGKCLTWLFPCPCWGWGLVGGPRLAQNVWPADPPRCTHPWYNLSFTRTCSQILALQEILFWYLPRASPVFLYFSNSATDFSGAVSCLPGCPPPSHNMPTVWSWGGLPPHQDVLPASLASHQAVSHQEKEAPPRTALASHLPSSFHTSLLGLLVCSLHSGLGAGCQLTWSCASLRPGAYLQSLI